MKYLLIIGLCIFSSDLYAQQGIAKENNTDSRKAVVMRSQKWLDSVARYTVLSEKELENPDGPKVKRYMQANALLGSYYEEQFAAGKMSTLDLAMKYYNRGLKVNFGGYASPPDSDHPIVMERNAIAQRVAGFYNAGDIPLPDTLRSYVIGRYLDVGRIDMKNSFSGPLSDNNPAIIRYFYGTDELSGDAKSALGELCKSTGNLAQKIVVSGCGGNDSYYGQMLSWLQTRNITEYLADACGIPSERLIFQYAQPGEPGTVQVRLAKEGEDGPPMAAPPISGNIEPY